MRYSWTILVMAMLASGCAGYRTQARLDAYESVKVDELRGNKVSRGVFDRRTLWLNARRETASDRTQHHYLITELTPSPDFTQQANGESLVLLVDGVRYGFSATNSQAPFVSRPGIISTLYPVAPEVLISLANAQEVSVRLKGTTSVIDEIAPPSVMEHFKAWMLQSFTPETPAGGPSDTPQGGAPEGTQRQPDNQKKP